MDDLYELHNSGHLRRMIQQCMNNKTGGHQQQMIPGMPLQKPVF
jgi:hypothetical protein